MVIHVDPRKPENRKFMVKYIFKSKDLYNEYLGYFKQALKDEEEIPDVIAWIEFRKKWEERPDGTWRQVMGPT